MKTLDDLAHELGVSTSTVSRALSDHPSISRATRDAVQLLASEQGYSPPPRRRPPSREAAITLVIPPYLPHQHGRIIQPFILSLIEGIAVAMRERGLTFQVSHRLVSDDESVRALIDDRPNDGWIFLGQTQFHSELNRQAKLGRSFVVWGADRPDQLYCSVGSDNFQGAFRATSHILRLGRRRVAFVGNPKYFEIADRYEGYSAALRHHGIEPTEELVLASELGIEDGLDAAEGLIGRGVKFDAAFTATDMLAFGLIRGLMRRGKRVPDDVSVVGYDDVDSAQHATPALSTIRQDPLRAGRLITFKLIRLMGRQRVTSERMPAELIVRESCGG